MASICPRNRDCRDAPCPPFGAGTLIFAGLRCLGFIVAISCLTSTTLGCSHSTTQAADEPAESSAQDDSEEAGERQDEADQSESAHRSDDQPNRLADETSPYLLMHAHNPVDWYPWGEEALNKAKEENKLIFLSIGYSSCHWCHVMERESFMDKEIAEYLNEHYVCIKVDREERPDIDAIYMRSLYVFNELTGRRRGGGWPLSMFLTPDAKPFFGGTYFPARDGDRGAGTGFLTIVEGIHEIWKDNAAGISRDADRVAEYTQLELRGLEPSATFSISEGLFDRAVQALARTYDEAHGGFGFDPNNAQVPKFPEPSNLVFLVHEIKKLRGGGELDEDTKAREANMLAMLTGTLDHMARGGIRDHLGGGFHRYSVDRYWDIPHFEKMLYDNGQLASVYAETYALTGHERYRRVVEELVEYTRREMVDSQGGFYAALDADSEGVEGKFYRWTREEIEELLSAEEFALIAERYGLLEEPNFEEEFYALRLTKPLADTLDDQFADVDELETKLAPIRNKLLAARAERPRPLTDTKVLTGWNGLMIRGLADAGRIFERPEYIELAADAARFVLDKMRTDEGRLLRTYGQGQAKYNAYLPDYAYLIDGMIGLHQATGDDQWLKHSAELMQIQLDLFWDDEQGGFYFTSSDHESLLSRVKNPADGARPAGNSVAADNLVYLANELERPEWLEKAKDTIWSVSAILDRAPVNCPRMLVAAERFERSK